MAVCSGDQNKVSRSSHLVRCCRFHPTDAPAPHRAPAGGRGLELRLKLDGYRTLAIKSGGKVAVRSRNDKNFNSHYPAIAAALATMPDETAIDGEVVALDRDGRPSFNLLQNAAGGATLLHYVFDVLVLAGRDVMDQALTARRKLLAQHVLPNLTDPIRESPVLDAALPDLITSVRAQRLDDLVAKRLDSRYEPGRRSGAWQKMRMNRGQEFVIGGYTVGEHTFDAWCTAATRETG